MASVIDYRKCPKCGCEEMSCEYWYKTDEYSELCPKCGYFRRKFLKRDENREPIILTEDIRREDVVILKKNKWVLPEKDEDLSNYHTSKFVIKTTEGIKSYPSFARMDKDGTKVSYPDYTMETGGGYGAVHVKYANYLECTLSIGEKEDPEQIKKSLLKKDNVNEIVSVDVTYPG